MASSNEASVSPIKSLIPLPRKDDAYPVPPFDEITTIHFGIPGSGKTWFCANQPNCIVFATEPGSQFTKATVVDVPNWERFRSLVGEIAQSRKAVKEGTIKSKEFPYTSFVVDIVDNLHGQCRDFICKQKGLAYPPTTDFGKTWSEITNEWKGWLNALMRLGNVRFITHCTQAENEVVTENGAKVEVSQNIPTFRGNKAAQYLDGIVNAVAFHTQNKKGEYVVTFQQSPTIAAKDRTDILNKLGHLPSNWEVVTTEYAKQAKKMGLKIQSKGG